MAFTGLQTTYDATPAIAYAGMLQGGDNDVRSGKNAEASANMPFGIAVVRKTSGATSDIDMLLPSATTQKPAGIVVHSHTHPLFWQDATGSHGELAATGLVPGTIFNLLREGLISVPVATGCAPGQRLWVRCIANGAISTQLGSCENANDGSNMIDATQQGEFVSTAAAGGFGWLDCDFLNKP